MNVSIKLNYNNAYKWYKNDKIYVIGYVYYQDKFYKNDQLLEFISGLSKKDLLNMLKDMDGSFLFIINTKDECFIISDLMRTFPLFYKIKNDKIIINDDIMQYQDRILDEKSEQELLGSGYVTGDSTLFKDIYQIEAHQVVEFNLIKHSITKKKYFSYKYKIIDKAEKYLIRKMDLEFDNAIKKLIKYLDGRTAVVPLSGGNDSRLIVYYLKKNNYDKIITYTYGSANNSEVEISKKVAEYLNVDWHFIEYKNKSMQNKFNNKDTYKKMADYCGRGFSIPIMQEWEAISILDEIQIINKKSCVLVPGYSGDFIVGSHITDYLYSNKKLSYKKLLNHIYDNQYAYSNVLFEKSYIKEKLEKNINKNSYDSEINRSKNIEIYEDFDFEERQVKYITNAIRTYDYIGYEWYLPFWDKDLVNFCLTLPFEKKYKIDLFKKFTMTTYKDLMEYAPIFKTVNAKKINRPFKMVKKVYRIYEIYKNGFLNFYGYLYFRTYIKYFLKTKSYHYNKIFAQYYIDYIKEGR